MVKLIFRSIGLILLLLWIILMSLTHNWAIFLEFIKEFYLIFGLPLSLLTIGLTFVDWSDDSEK